VMWSGPTAAGAWVRRWGGGNRRLPRGRTRYEHGVDGPGADLVSPRWTPRQRRSALPAVARARAAPRRSRGCRSRRRRAHSPTDSSRDRQTLGRISLATASPMPRRAASSPNVRATPTVRRKSPFLTAKLVVLGSQSASSPDRRRALRQHQAPGSESCHRDSPIPDSGSVPTSCASWPVGMGRSIMGGRGPSRCRFATISEQRSLHALAWRSSASASAPTGCDLCGDSCPGLLDPPSLSACRGPKRRSASSKHAREPRLVRSS